MEGLHAGFARRIPNLVLMDPVDQADWEAQAQRLLDNGEVFLAYDVARRAREAYPSSVRLRQLCALALIRTGALGEARSILDAMVTPETRDEETLGLLARVAKEQWKRSGDHGDAVRSRDAYLRAFEITRGYWTGINAATMSWTTGDHEAAKRLAGDVLALCHAAQVVRADDAFWLAATRGEAHLLLGNDEEAAAAYQDAVRAGGPRSYVTSARQQLHLLAQHGFFLPPALTDLLKPPGVVIFAGHPIDRPDELSPCFPASLESAVRTRIDQQLDALMPEIGYGSAGCGADLLFLEAMQERGLETHVVLPIGCEDFEQTFVLGGGAEWVRRFQRALERADSVKCVSPEPLLQDWRLFEFLSEVFLGYCVQKARLFGSEPMLLTVWDGDTGTGGVADIVALWPEHLPHQTIRVDALRAQSPAAAPFAPQDVSRAPRVSAAEPPSGPRVVRSLLFADIVGYTSLREEAMPFFMYRFLTAIAERLPVPTFVNTWGDAFFVVMERAVPLADYALALQDVVCNTDWKTEGLDASLNIRIALHAGPVFEARDPLTGRTNYYGAHVNRTARMEPITIPGHVYASEQFVALLTTEEMRAHRSSPISAPDYACEYLGSLSLAKDSGTQVAYHLRSV